MLSNFKQFFDSLTSLISPQFPSHANEYPTYKVKIDGVTINYAKIGHGKPLVFIHGWANNWEGWIPIIPYLKDYHALYLVDLPGFGDSSNLSSYSIEINARFLSLFLKKLQLKPLAVVGLSMGSFVVAQLAYKFPNLLHRAVLLGPLVKNSQSFSPNKMLSFSLNLCNRTSWSKTSLKRLIESRVLSYLVSKYFNMYHFDYQMIDSYGMYGKKLLRIEAFIGMGLSFNSYNLKKILPQIKIPTLLVYGREDKIASFHPAKTILPQSSFLKLQTIPFAGHMVHWEKTKEVAEKIKSFIE